jgi:RNA polymerase sigma-70 factor (ECF subfamily)
MSFSSFNDLEDAELVRRFLAGDEQAFVELMGRHRPKIANLTYGILRNRSDAEEITQDTFIRAHRALANFRGDCAVGTWLYMMAVNLSRNRYWYWWRRRRHLTDSLEFPITENGEVTVADVTPCPGLKPNATLELDEIAVLIDAGMERLNPIHREILILRNVLHQSYEEIAAGLGINVGTVKSRIARARENLRKDIAERLPSAAEKEAFAS